MSVYSESRILKETGDKIWKHHASIKQDHQKGPGKLSYGEKEKSQEPSC
jgi:hypothetical protein